MSMIKPISKDARPPMVDYLDEKVGMLPVFMDEAMVNINKNRDLKLPFHLRGTHTAILSFCNTVATKAEICKFPNALHDIDRALKDLKDHQYIIYKGGYYKTTVKGQEFVQYVYHLVAKIAWRWEKDVEYLLDRKSNWNGESD